MTGKWREFLGATELLGGIATIAGYALTAAVARDLYPTWELCTGVAFGAFAAFAGVRLLRGQALGAELSALVQLLQVVNVTVVPRLTYVALAGLRVRAAITETGVHFDIGGGGEFVAVPWAQDGALLAIGGALQLTFGVDPHEIRDSSFAVAINLAAVYFLYRLVAFMRTGRRTARVSALDAPVA